jgi:hypothetical protein
MPRAVFGLLLVACLVAVSTAPARGATPMRVTFVGDSVAASLTYVTSARARLSRGLRLTVDARVCRRLVQPSCSFQGSTPTTALEAVEAYGRSLGDVLVVKVGYNESTDGYQKGIDRVMRAALAQGAKEVVWVTLRETIATYHWTNVAIKRAAKRWPELVVADWNAYSSGRPWFGDDGLHLTVSGANALAGFVRRYALEALRPT